MAVTKILTDVNLLKTEPQADHNKYLVLATPEAQVVEPRYFVNIL